MYKRLLLISNCPLSLEDSNGRTLNNLVSGWTRNLAHFFVYGFPNSNICTNFYRVTDRDVLNSLMSFSEKDGKIGLQKEIINDQQKLKYTKLSHSPINMLLREFVWMISPWQGKKIKKWLEDFNPEMICLFLGNCIFLTKFALNISKRMNIPIIVYTCEDYYFKQYNYLTRKKSFFFEIYQYFFRKTTKKLFLNCSSSIYNTPQLMSLYKNEFGGDCHCIMTNSEIDFLNKAQIDEVPTIVFLGNLGLNRHKQLIDIANALNEINNKYILHVYGISPSEEVKNELIENKNINYHGFIQYDKVKEIIHHSDLLIHTESFSPYYCRDLAYGFSTKLADSICSGTPLFCYIPDKIITYNFIIENHCAFVSTNKNTLLNDIKNALYNREERSIVLEYAYKLRETVFNKNMNNKIFANIVNNVGK